MTRWFYLAVAVTVAAFAGSAYVYFFAYDRLPEQIPIHWDIHGTVDHWVSKQDAWVNFWLTPALMLGFLLLTLVLPWLSPRSFEVDRFRDTYGYVMAMVIVLFAFIHFLLLWVSFHPDFDMTRLMVGGIMFFFALLGNVLGRVRRNFWVGVRTPWTLANETVWNQTHRLAAWLYSAIGILACLAVLLGAPLVWCFVIFMIVVVIPVFYSLVLYKRLEREGRL